MPVGTPADTAPGVDLLRHDRPGPTLEVCPSGVPVGEVLGWVVDSAGDVPLPGGGRTRQRWEWLATLGAWDLVQARTAEPHLDALAILAEAGVDADPGSSWGVWAAEGPGQRLSAAAAYDGGTLSGTKPWCSLATHVSHGLVTAVPDGADQQRSLFAVATADPGLSIVPSRWEPTGLREVVTSEVVMDAVAARAVGGPGWYLERPGFWWGAMGVAAVWFGGAVAVARRLREQAERRTPDQVALVHLGAVDARLFAAGTVLSSAAAQVDAGQATGEAGARLAARVRQVVADAAEEVLWRCGHALGPGVLTGEPEHARRVADLTLYLRQHHAERDTAALGALVVREAGPAGTQT